MGQGPGEFGLVTDAVQDSAGQLLHRRIRRVRPHSEVLARRRVSLAMGRPRLRAGPVRPAAEPGDRRAGPHLGRRRLQPSHPGVRHRRASCSPCGARTAARRASSAIRTTWRFDGEGHVYVCEYGNHRVQKFTLDGSSLGCWGTSGRRPGPAHNPWALVHDSQGRIHVLDTEQPPRATDRDVRPHTSNDKSGTGGRRGSRGIRKQTGDVRLNKEH